MYSGSNTERNTMKTFIYSLAFAIGLVLLHGLVTWVAYNLPWLAGLFIVTGILAFTLLLLEDLGMVRFDLSKMFNRTSR